MAGTVIQSVLDRRGTMWMTGENAEGFHTAVALLVLERTRSGGFTFTEEMKTVPSWLEKVNAKYQALAVPALREKDKLAVVQEFARNQLCREISALTRYPLDPEVAKSPEAHINLNLWDAALRYLGATLEVVEYSGNIGNAVHPSALLGAGDIDLGKVCLYAHTVWIVSEEELQGVQLLPCECPVINVKVEIALSDNPSITLEGRKCHVHNVDIPPEALLGEVVTDPGQMRAAVPDMCILCNKKIFGKGQFCPSNCYCLTCGYFLSLFENEQEQCHYCRGPIKVQARDRFMQQRAKCCCGETISLQEGLLCTKNGHILCGKCCALDGQTLICCVCKSECKSKSKPLSVYNCCICEGEWKDDNIQMDCKHVIHRQCYGGAKTKCLRCSRIASSK